MKSTKSQSEGLMIFSALAVLMVVMVVFGILTVIAPKENFKVKIQEIGIENSQITLLNYLKTNLPNSQDTFQDLIIKWFYDNSLENELIEKTNAIFTQIYGDCYALSILNNEQETILTFNKRQKRDSWVNQKIPLPDGDHITIALNPSKFYADCNGF